MVGIYLKNKDREFTSLALVDSGSTMSFLPTVFKEILNLTDFEDSEAIGGGGTFPTSLGRLELLRPMKGDEAFDTYRQLKVHIPKNIDAIPYAVLGRDSIFKHFDITFHEARKRMTFRRIKLTT